MSAPGDNTYRMPADAAETSQTRQSNALHALAQPLTALSFILDIARRQSDPVVWHSALGDGLDECRRAVVALEQLRSALQETSSSQTASPSPDIFGDKQ